MQDGANASATEAPLGEGAGISALINTLHSAGLDEEFILAAVQRFQPRGGQREVEGPEADSRA